jgi:hypothetical protein
MKKLLRRTIDRNRENLGAPTAPQWDEWLEKVFNETAKKAAEKS